MRSSGVLAARPMRSMTGAMNLMSRAGRSGWATSTGPGFGALAAVGRRTGGGTVGGAGAGALTSGDHFSWPASTMVRRILKRRWRAMRMGSAVGALSIAARALSAADAIWSWWPER